MATSLELAITAIRSGRREEGRQLLNLLIQQNPNDEMAWLWMSSVVDTDEQRARCLYHVLAIDPDNVVARQGLKVLGIVVSDSRPVKVPRDSQPINIPKPSVKPPTGPLKALPEPAEERRPFRIDPQAIVAELPFTPVKAPFTQDMSPTPASNSDSVEPLEASDQRDAKKPQPIGNGKTGPLPGQSEPAWVKRAKAAPQSKRQTGSLQQPAHPGPLNANSPKIPPVPIQRQTGTLPNVPRPMPMAKAKPPLIAPRQKPQTGTLAQSAPQTPVQTFPTNNTSPGEAGQLPYSSEPVLTAPQPQDRGQTEPMPGAQPQPTPEAYPQQFISQSSPVDTGQLSGPTPMGQPLNQGAMPIPDTRPTPPMSMPQQAPMPNMPVYGYNNAPQVYGAPNFQPNMSMGMPHQAPMQPYSHSVAAMHAQATLGMPLNNQVVYPAGAMPVIHSNPTMGMPMAVYPQYQQQPAPNPAIHSNSTMVMPAGQPNLVDYHAVKTSRPSAKSANNSDEAEEEEEGINILAVIIFGSLSVTALGGLGMLILLMFAAK